MPKVVERSTVKPWFRETPAAKVVRLAVRNSITIQKAAMKLKAAPKVIKEAVAIKAQWDEDIMNRIILATSRTRSNYGR